MEKKTKNNKEIVLSQVNTNIKIENETLYYKRVRIPFIKFDQEFCNQIEGLVALALEQSKTKGPVRLNKIEYEGKTYKILNEIKDMVGNNDNMAAGATLLANLPHLKQFIGLYYHDLWVGGPKHFKQHTTQKDSVRTLDPSKLPKLPKV